MPRSSTASKWDWPRARTPSRAQQAASEAAMPASTASDAATLGVASSTVVVDDQLGSEEERLGLGEAVECVAAVTRLGPRLRPSHHATFPSALRSPTITTRSRAHSVRIGSLARRSRPISFGVRPMTWARFPVHRRICSASSSTRSSRSGVVGDDEYVDVAAGVTVSSGCRTEHAGQFGTRGPFVDRSSDAADQLGMETR